MLRTKHQRIGVVVDEIEVGTTPQIHGERRFHRRSHDRPQRRRPLRRRSEGGAGPVELPTPGGHFAVPGEDDAEISTCFGVGAHPQGIYCKVSRSYFIIEHSMGRKVAWVVSLLLALGVCLDDEGHDKRWA